MNKTLRYLFSVIIFFNYLSATDQEPLKVHIFCEANGKGLEKDRNILKESLESLNCTVECFENNFQVPAPDADVNIFVQHINPNQIQSAKHNWFIPNPEWCFDDIALLESMDLILCRTREVERIFKNLNLKTYFLSFTTKDRYFQNIKKQHQRYLHVAGSSEYKGTRAIIKAWEQQNRFPHLTILKMNIMPLNLNNLKIINRYVSEERVIRLQNECFIHLCPSETEGFGHYIMESMSTGAVVLTTNAPPMNEFIEDERCLIPYEQTSFQRLGILYYVGVSDIEKHISKFKQLPIDELLKIGKSNRERYLMITKAFNENLKNLIDQILRHRVD